MRFSLVVCTFGRSKELADLFASLLRQNRTDFELIVVDQNSDSRLVEIVARFADRFPLKHIRVAGRGASLGRNIGMDHVTGELIGFPDDDCQYLDGYLDAVHQVFAGDPSIGCITGFPTDNTGKQLGNDWNIEQMDLDTVTVLDRCQEFTVFVRKESLRDFRYNERLGVGSRTPWGADEGPDILIRLIQAGARVVYFPHLFVYHPNKLATFDSATRRRAAGYSRGRGCLFRLHRFPRKTIFKSILRPAMGCFVYLLKCQPMRCAYYFTILTGTLRGLLMSKAELKEVRDARPTCGSTIQPLALPPLLPQPLVSVLIANYNYARFLPAALDALLLQTYPNWQAIICDDGSTDHSMQVIEQYCHRDPRIQVIQKSNGGQNSAYNACYREGRGEIICLLDADDVFDLHKLQQVVDAFLTNPQAGMCNHFCQVIDSAGQRQAVTMHGFLDCGWLADKALTRGACVYVPTTSCMSLRREIGDILFPVPPRQERDLDGYLAMASQFLAPICIIYEKLASYRIHGDNMGGLTQPTPQRLRYELRLIAARTSTVKEFVRQRFGENRAAQIVLEDNPQHIQAALKLLVVEAGDLRPPWALDLIRRHPSAKWRAIWHVIFALPAALSRSAVPWMHRSYRAKAVVHRFLGRGKVVTT
jgi:glycosyltransferase involved in cell wall biosynthesis